MAHSPLCFLTDFVDFTRRVVSMGIKQLISAGFLKERFLLSGESLGAIRLMKVALTMSQSVRNNHNVF